MVRLQAAAAYAIAELLTVATLGTTVAALHRPWLSNAAHHRVSLTRYCVENECIGFPGRELCAGRPGFCGAWRTATFLLAIAIGLSLLAVLAVLFSWVSGRRKRTVIVLDILISLQIVLQFGALVLLSSMVKYSDYFKHGGWKFEGSGRLMLIGSLWALVLTKFLMQRFRRIIKGPEEDDYDSDMEDDDLDTVSIDDDIEEHARDFHIFTKQARRDALRRAEGEPDRLRSVRNIDSSSD